MRDLANPWPKTEKELLDTILEHLKEPHDYGSCAYAMSLAATAAFNYVAHKLGVTGFQASCADLDFLRRSRGYKGPFMVLDGAKLLYPQYDVPGNVAEWIGEQRGWLRDEARKLLAERSEMAHPEVIAHWKKLAEN